MSPDQINGAFELIGAILTMIDIRVIWRDKQVRGVYWPSRLFFLTWGLWNVYFYSYYDHWWSWLGGLTIAAANLVWVTLAWHFEVKRKFDERLGT